MFQLENNQRNAAQAIATMQRDITQAAETITKISNDIGTHMNLIQTADNVLKDHDKIDL